MPGRRSFALWLFTGAVACHGLRLHHANADDFDEEDLAELDSLEDPDVDLYGEDLIGEDAFNYFDAHDADPVAILGEEAKDMLEALLNGENGLASLLESLGLDIGLDDDDEDGDDFGTVRLLEDVDELNYDLEEEDFADAEL